MKERRKGSQRRTERRKPEERRTKNIFPMGGIGLFHRRRNQFRRVAERRKLMDRRAEDDN